MLGTRLAEHGFVHGRTRGRPQVRAWFGIGLRSDDDPSDPEIHQLTTESEPLEAVDMFTAQTYADAFAPTVPSTGTDQGIVPDNASACVSKLNASTRHELLTTAEQLASILPDLVAAEVLGLDVETTGLNARSDRLRLVQLAMHDRVVLIDAASVDLAPLAAVLDGTGTLVGHNLGFDLAFLHAAGLPIPNGEHIFDTMLASQVLDGGAQAIGATVADPSGAIGRGGSPQKLGFHTLAALVHRTLGIVLDKELQKSDWSGPLHDEQLAYAARDAAALLPLRDVLLDKLAVNGLQETATLEFAALPAAVWLEATGAPLDASSWTLLRDNAATELTVIDADLRRLLPGVNANAPKQVVSALAARGITVADAREQTLRALGSGSGGDDPVVALLLRRKEVAKRVSTYGESYLAHVDSETGRVHASYRLIGAASGRMACSKPNLQNIPREPAYRRCVRPNPGRLLVKADYAQIELRIAAQLTGDRALLAAFHAGEDLHIATARAVLGREPSASDRQLAKALNFGLLYGMGATRLREYAASDYGVCLTEPEAEQFRSRFFQAYPGLRAWHRSHRDGVVETRTMCSRVRRDVERFTEKLNSPVQGTGADILKSALARLWTDRAAVPSAAPVLVVHDEIVFEVDQAEAEVCAAWLTMHMIAAGAAVLTEVPVEVETHILTDWSGSPWAPDCDGVAAGSDERV